ncbi:hypothetical protein [Niallia taxi]|uniref:hypothetical protein n=1 Tax=Niallia taxi TaxID=2499688 RepID=UPI0015F4E75C|nr:hypothetical protein [Niallia taxi]
MKISDVLNDIKKALQNFKEANPKDEAIIIFNPEVLQFFKENLTSTYRNGKSTRIFGSPFDLDEDVEYLEVRKIKVTQ